MPSSTVRTKNDSLLQSAFGSVLRFSQASKFGRTLFPQTVRRDRGGSARRILDRSGLRALFAAYRIGCLQVRAGRTPSSGRLSSDHSETDPIRPILQPKSETADQKQFHHGHFPSFLLLNDEPDSFADQHQRGDCLLQASRFVFENWTRNRLAFPNNSKGSLAGYPTKADFLASKSDLIDSKEKLLETSRIACWFLDDSNYNFLKNSQTGSDLNRIFNKRKPDGSLCLLDSVLSNYGLIAGFDVLNTFYLTNKLVVYFVLSIFSRIIKKIVLENSFLDYELLQVHLVRASLNRNLKAQLLVK